jgi:hypothetical protein
MTPLRPGRGKQRRFAFRRASLGVLLLAGVLIAGCSAGDEGTVTDQPTAADTATSEASSVSTETSVAGNPLLLSDGFDAVRFRDALRRCSAPTDRGDRE